MLTNFFYHKTIRRATAVFGSLFNNISVRNVHSQTGDIIKETKIPIAYGPKTRWLERTKTNADPTKGEKVSIQLPRIGFYITSLTYDPEIATAMLHRPTHKVNNSSLPMRLAATRSYNYTPYQLSMQLSIISNRQDELFQILEQIVPYFRPTFHVTINQTEDLQATWDMPITLVSTAPTDTFESDFASRREIMWDLDFDIKIRFFGPISSEGVIHRATVNFIEEQGDEYPLERIIVEAEPDSPSESGYTIAETYIDDFFTESD